MTIDWCCVVVHLYLYLASPMSVWGVFWGDFCLFFVCFILLVVWFFPCFVLSALFTRLFLQMRLFNVLYSELSLHDYFFR